MVKVAKGQSFSVPTSLPSIFLMQKPTLSTREKMPNCIPETKPGKKNVYSKNFLKLY
jgi:hypothetical protein